MEEFDLSDYITVLRRRMKLFAISSAALFVLSVIVAFSWSNYRSEATIEVAQPEILMSYTSKEAGNTTSLESLVDMHISRLQQKVLSTASLVEIITKFNLYPEKRKTLPLADIADKMRAKIRIKLLSSTLANPATAQKATVGQLSAIAFDIAFDYTDPALAQNVTNELVSRFLDEDARQRRSKAQETTSFLDSQLKTLEESLAEQEQKIASFRTANGDIRPEALAFNQQAVVSTQMSLQTLEAQIASNLGSQGALRAQLAVTDPYSRVVADGKLLTTPSTQLKAMKSEQAALLAKYGPAHPDVLKINRQVAALESETGGVNVSAQLEARLADVKAKLATLRQHYGPENPDIINLQKQQQGLEKQIREERARPLNDPAGIVPDADNPAYLQILAQLRATGEQHRALSTQRDELSKQLAKYKSAVVQNPAVEQQMAALSRDYDNAQLRYRELKAKRLEAAMNETIEQDRSGQRLVVINPPELPLRTQPARLLFLVGGFVMALGGGLATVIATQLISQTVIGSRHLQSLTGASPLILLPHIGTKEEKVRLTKQSVRAALFALAGFIVVLVVFSYVVMPLDVLWSVIVRRLGLY